jgi:hypothetical protein
MPLFEPGCPVPLVVDGWGLAASTTPAEGSSRQAPIVREAMTCFISALLFKMILHTGGIAWEKVSVRRNDAKGDNPAIIKPD